MAFRFVRKQRGRINLALQGGGAHGAFTWGVLDYLLEHGALDIEGISGTSAGAMNAVAVAHGFMENSYDGARETLSLFWGRVASSSPFKMASRTSDDSLLVSPALTLMMSFTHYFSPYQLNPLELNPLRDIVTSLYDFDKLAHQSPIKLFIATTHANSGHLRLFQTHEINADVLMASACLPALHHSVEMDGEPYWDGGYSANPAIFPLYYHCQSPDILLILLTPAILGSNPITADEIKTRAMDIAFNAAFLREMRSIDEARQFATRTWLPKGPLERNLLRLRFHMISPDERMHAMPSATRMVADRDFLHLLRDMGREQAQNWLQQHRRRIGRESSLDIGQLFRCHPA
ncbi:patatin-like phospholipase family protein [Parathalassolituus penaei]|uniref:Patatin-like phospholipase family protein n=1 Tax=Parathalassolituus penaei TaxID=2997323 RepID=A0A9X3IR45_9GAMM|nr:patatin-like phospholipase family protein [Parathalassolituus penaei]MCY0963845.1 patatin-like phospholipase family protein [Parathalassolituus penaei]